jgi:T-complex protein 1 subunit eta
VVEAIRTTLGPRGMDKLIVDNNGKATISNDGATILKALDIVHPAAKTLVDIAKSQDAEVGDGTTTVVLLAGEFLKQAKPHVEEGVHSRIILESYRKGAKMLVKKSKKLLSVLRQITKKNKGNFWSAVHQQPSVLSWFHVRRSSSLEWWLML